MKPFRRILFPVDFSDATLAMVPSVNEMVQHFGATLTLLNAFHRAPDYVLDTRFQDIGASAPAAIPYTPEFQKLRTERQQRLEQFARAHFHGVAATPIVEDGEPAEVIDWVAQQQKSDLIMMPTNGEGKFRPLLLGSIAAKVLHDVKCPVWTSAHGPASEAGSSSGYRSIVCAVGVSVHAQPPLKMTEFLARSFGARICLLHVDQFADDSATSSAEALRNAFDAVGRRDSRKDLDISVRVFADAIPEGIRQVALEEAADLVVVGRGHARAGISRAWSHLYSIIRESPCPVLSV